MKILVVNKFLYYKGGSETYMFHLFEYMKKLGHEIEYFGMEDSRNVVGNSAGENISNLDFNGNMLRKASYPFKVIYSLEAKSKISKVIKSFKPDIVHLNNYNYQVTPSIIYEIKKYNLPVVQTLHDPQLVCPYHRLYNNKRREYCEKCSGGRFVKCVTERCIDNSMLKSILGALEGYIYRQLGTYNYIDYFISPSHFLKEKIISMSSNISREKFRVLHNFTNSIITEYTAVKEPYVLYFGRISAAKGIQTLISACKNLPQIKFKFAGSGQLENELTGIDNVEFLGYKTGEELKNLISKALFSVCPSEWFENCPMSVLESQMYGTPVIGSNIGGIPELIKNNYDGLLFASGDSEDLTRKIKYLYDNDAILKRFSENCIKKAREFSIENYCEKLKNIYNLAIEKHLPTQRVSG